jgi:uncharacterized protein with PQ loop repeat
VQVHGAGVAQVFGCAGAVLAVGLNAPQAWTSCRRGLVSGLSPAARWLALVHSATWVAYGIAEDVALQVATNVVCSLLHAAVLVALLVLVPDARRSRVVVPSALLAAGWLAVVALCAATAAVPVGTLAAAAGTVAVVPQLWRLLRDPDQDTSGVSAATTLLSLLANLCWTAHGALLAEAAVVVPSLVGATAAACTLALLGERAPNRGAALSPA